VYPLCTNFILCINLGTIVFDLSRGKVLSHFLAPWPSFIWTKISILWR